jgi:hypothetical protein
MRAQHQSSSESKANTLTIDVAPTARHLMAIRIVGTALFDYQVSKTPNARIRLECLATMAQQLGDISATEAAVVARLLAKPISIEGATL